MKTAIVTGTSSGIGKAIAIRLLHLGYKVIGVSRRASNIEDRNFSQFTSNLANTAETIALGEKLKTEKGAYILINAAGFGRFEPHEELSPKTIEAMIHVNLTAPILLSNLLLRTLKQNSGYLINITSIEATRSSKFSALYSSTKAGLRAFGSSLFEEVRKSDLTVVTINPDMTDTAFFDELKFGVPEADHSRLESSDIADAVEQVLAMRHGVAVTELTVRSQRFGITKKH
ncbi:MAG: SDR family NAD(P)-dependent oxidoreductase [Campylobacterota bacterium]|nr:SDR family NAD(P)-dependent oxidoreductase [Campylobacterota bacterium]